MRGSLYENCPVFFKTPGSGVGVARSGSKGGGVRVAMPETFGVRVAMPETLGVRVAMPETFGVRVAMPETFGVRVGGSGVPRAVGRTPVMTGCRVIVAPT